MATSLCIPELTSGGKKKSACISSMGCPLWLSGKESTCNAGDPGLIPGLGRSPREGNGNPLQYFYLDNFMYRGADGLQSTERQMSWKRLNN